VGTASPGSILNSAKAAHEHPNDRFLRRLRVNGLGRRVPVSMHGSEHHHLDDDARSHAGVGNLVKRALVDAAFDDTGENQDGRTERTDGRRRALGPPLPDEVSATNPAESGQREDAKGQHHAHWRSFLSWTGRGRSSLRRARIAA
jgi:hypothetical protein